jgi:hypothetical protein
MIPIDTLCGLESDGIVALRGISNVVVKPSFLTLVKNFSILNCFFKEIN